LKNNPTVPGIGDGEASTKSSLPENVARVTLAARQNELVDVLILYG